MSKDIPREPGYGFADITTVTTATRSNLIHWTNIGLITGEVADTEGRGHHRRFSTFNAIEVQTCAAISQFKVPTVKLLGALEALRSFHRNAVANYDATWALGRKPDAQARRECS